MLTVGEEVTGSVTVTVTAGRWQESRPGFSAFRNQHNLVSLKGRFWLSRWARAWGSAFLISSQVMLVWLFHGLALSSQDLGIRFQKQKSPRRGAGPGCEVRTPGLESRDTPISSV